MYSETITIFNRIHSRNGDIWCPHVLYNVDLIVDKASIKEKMGAESKDSAKLHIKYDKGLTIQGLKYYPPKEWSNLSNKEGTITFNDDSNYFDFFIVGEYAGTEQISDNNYSEGFYAAMEKEKDYCFAITSVSSPYKVIPHFEIMAK